MNKLEILLVFLAVVCAVIISTLFTTAIAGGKHDDIVINNYYETNNYYPSDTKQAPVTTTTADVTPLSITSGISDSDLAKGLSGVMAVGAHSFDYSTQDFQGSVTAALYDDETGFSVGIAKRWEKIDAMFHAAGTQVGSDTAVVIGTTFRF